MPSVAPRRRPSPLALTVVGAVASALIAAPPAADAVVAAPARTPAAVSAPVAATTVSTDAGVAARPQARRSRTVLTPSQALWMANPRLGMRTPLPGPLRVRKDHAAGYVEFPARAVAGRTVVGAQLRLWVHGARNRGGLAVSRTSAGQVVRQGGQAAMESRLNSRVHLQGNRWVTVSLDRMSGVLRGGVVGLRLTAARDGGWDYFGRRGVLAPRLVLVTEAPPEEQPPTEPGTPTQPGPTGPGQPGDFGTDAKVFAHYYPFYPISYENLPPDRDYYAREFLTPDGENGKHAAYAGYLRDRPIPRAPLGGDWRMQDKRNEIRDAKAAGLDGFQVNILDLFGQNWDWANQIMKASDLEGDFTVVPMLDQTTLANDSVTEIADKTAELLQYESTQTIGGEKVVSTFCAECRTVAWWTEFIRQMEQVHGIPIKFIATFVGGTVAQMREFAPIAYGVGSWGTRNAENALRMPNYAASAHELGLKWMSAVAVQDARPRWSTYAEAGNTDTLRATWQRAREDGADFVQLTTWNDFSESTQFAPSVAHGRVFVDLNRYFADWYKKGAPPAIFEDHVYVTHRIQKYDADPASGIKLMQPNLGGSKVAPRDTAEALVLLTAPATVTLTSGANTVTKALPAGLSTVLVPLDYGTVSARVVRDGRTTASVSSPHTVVRTPAVQDMQYYAAGS